MRIIINVREYGGTYIARAREWNLTASCTMGYAEAAKRCAEKVAMERDLVLEAMKQVGKSSTWIATYAERAGS